MLTTALSDKVSQYIDGFLQLKSREPMIGAMIVTSRSRNSVLAALRQNAVVILDYLDEHPDVFLDQIVKAVGEVRPVAINLTIPLPQKLASQLNNFASGQVQLFLESGNSFNAVEIPGGSKFLLIFDEEYYDSFPHQSIITSVCRTF